MCYKILIFSTLISLQLSYRVALHIDFCESLDRVPGPLEAHMATLVV